MDVNRRSALSVALVVSGACSGLLMASPAISDLVFRLAGTRDGVVVRPLVSFYEDMRAHGITRWLTVRRPSSSRSDEFRSGSLRPPPAAFSHERPDLSPSRLIPATSLATNGYSLSSPVYLLDPAMAQAKSIAVGDVSGDGRDDLVFQSVQSTPDRTDSRMEIMVAYQRQDGSLDAAVKIADADNVLAYQLVIADLDRDGVGDIVTTTHNGVMILLSNGDRTFTYSAMAVDDPLDLVVTDVDRDGNPDILVDSSDTSATVIHGDSIGGFFRTSSLPLPSSAVRAIGDVTGDGLDDLILATIFGRPLQEIRIYPARATGGYDQPRVLYLPNASNQPSSIAIGDFNSDGRSDLIVDEAKDSADMHVFLQDAQGNLMPGRNLARQRGSGVLIAADLDRDGRTDVAIAHSGWSYVGYYLQTTNGFTPETVVETYQYAGRKNYFSAGDLNHDGCGDLVVSRISQSPVVVYGRGCTVLRSADCRLLPRRVASTHSVRPTSGSVGWDHTPASGTPLRSASEGTRTAQGEAHPLH